MQIEKSTKLLPKIPSSPGTKTWTTRQTNISIYGVVETGQIPGTGEDFILQFLLQGEADSTD